MYTNVVGCDEKFKRGTLIEIYPRGSRERKNHVSFYENRPVGMTIYIKAMRFFKPHYWIGTLREGGREDIIQNMEMSFPKFNRFFFPSKIYMYKRGHVERDDKRVTRKKGESQEENS